MKILINFHTFLLLRYKFASILIAKELAASIKGIGPATKEKLEKLYSDYLEYDAMHADHVGHFVERITALISGRFSNLLFPTFQERH